ncbi:MAG: ABC transporter substrate-binding protein [Candidatus Krumholzibacteria bacterium]|nr:ABC transporter substrate-binding protein [Candidatus Krumholzibacteria bacterium]
MIRRLLSIAVSLISALLIVSCGGGEVSPVLRLALQTEPTNLDPALAVDYSSGWVSSLIHSNVVRFEPDGSIAPDLARSWSVSADGLEYVFHVTGGMFSDGRPVTAIDVERSLTRLVDPSTASPRWWVLEPVAGAPDFHAGRSGGCSIKARDDSTLVIRLGSPASHFLSLLAMPAAGIVSPAAADSLGRDYGRTPTGSGPWRLVSWTSGDEIVLERNPFSCEAAAGIPGINIRLIPESMTRIAEFEVGNLDILEIPPAELELWRSAGVRLLRSQELRIVYIGLNTEKAPFDDPRVRRALNMAVDIDLVIGRLLFGAAERATGVVPAGLRGSPLPGPLYRYDPEGAVRLLEEAGYPDGFTMEIWQRENPESGRILESMQGFLARAGIEVKLVTREWSAFKQAVDMGTPDAFYLDWFADYPEAGNFLVPLFHSESRGGGGNRAGFSDAAVDSILDAASAVSDPAARWELYAEAEGRVLEAAPWIFLWFPVRYEVVSHRLEGYEIPVIFNGQRFTGVSLR